MDILAKLGLTALAAGSGAALFGAWAHARDERAAEEVWHALRATRKPMPEAHDPTRIADLPEIAQRYFRSAIAPGTMLHRTVELEMEGSFLLNGRALPMHARQILAPPHGLVWRARIGRGMIAFAGSDGYWADHMSWTRFWLHGLIPLARAGGTADHARASAARMAMETIWTPAALLPQAGAVWRQTGPDRAEVEFPAIRGIEPVAFTIDQSGQIIEASTLRWTDANTERKFRLQPFGGRILAHGEHEGFTIPLSVEIGNFHGTADYAPFFRATITRVRYS